MANATKLPETELNHTLSVLYIFFLFPFSFDTHDLLILLRGLAELLFGRTMEHIHFNCDTFSLGSDNTHSFPTSGRATNPSSRTQLSDRSRAVVHVVRSNIQSRH